MGNKTSKNKIIPFNNGSYFVGKTNDSVKINGKGILTDENGNKYIGNFKDNKLNGYGEVFYNNQTFVHYKGYWINDFKHGKGELHFSDGSKYNGKFMYDEPHGFGKFEYPDGSFYIGNFKCGFIFGKGKYYSKDKKILYEGEWFLNKRSGYGKSFNENGKIEYKGNWKNNLFIY